MNMKFQAVALGLAASALTSSLAAQDVKRFDVGGSFVMATDNLKEITNKSGFAGGTIDFGVNGHLANTGVLFRASLGVNFLPGTSALRNAPYDNTVDNTPLATTPQTTKGSLVGYQLSGDIFINTGFQGLRMVTGISVNKWTLKRSATFAVDTADKDLAGHTIVPIPAGTVLYNESGSVKGIKLGGRFGVEYTINQNWSASAMLQYVELGTDYYNTKAWNPTWVQFGAKFHF